MTLFDTLIYFAWIALGCLILFEGDSYPIPNYWLAFLICMATATLISRTETKRWAKP